MGEQRGTEKGKEKERRREANVPADPTSQLMITVAAISAPPPTTSTVPRAKKRKEATGRKERAAKTPRKVVAMGFLCADARMASTAGST